MSRKLVKEKQEAEESTEELIKEEKKDLNQSYLQNSDEEQFIEIVVYDESDSKNIPHQTQLPVLTSVPMNNKPVKVIVYSKVILTFQ